MLLKVNLILWRSFVFTHQHFLLRHILQLLHIFLFNISVAVSPDLGVAAVAALLGSSRYHIPGNTLQIVGPAQLSEEVDERRRRIVDVPQFTGFVVPREHVVIVVPAFTEGSKGHGQIFHWANVPETKHKSAIVMTLWKDLLIVGFLAPHMSHTVDEKCNVEGDGESHIEVNPKGIP